MPVPEVTQGTTAEIYFEVVDANNAPFTPLLPLVDVINPALSELVTDAVPVVVQTGLLRYNYAVAVGAPLGIWRAHITGTGYQGDVYFEVVEPVVAPATADDNSPLCQLWITSDDVEECCNTEGLEELTTAIQMASEILFYASGSQYPGICSLNYGPSTCEPDCYSRIDLWKATGNLPVATIESVTLYGDVLATSEYRLDGSRWLQRLGVVNGGNLGWPNWQRTDIPTADMDLVIALTYGVNPPLTGKRAAAKYACELAKACAAEEAVNAECQLPQRIQTITRDGVTIGAVVDPQDFLDDGRTGVPEIDAWLTMVNPSGVRSRAFIMSPEDLHHGLVF